MQTILMALLVLASLTLIVAVTISEPKAGGMGSAYGQDTNIFGIGGRKDREVTLNRVIIAAFIVFILSAILIQI